MRPKRNSIQRSRTSQPALRCLALVLGVCLTVLATPRAASADTLINFDDVPVGTVVNTHYPGVDISSCGGFSCFFGSDDATTVATANAFSGPNALSVVEGGFGFTSIEFFFDAPQSVVTLQGLGDPGLELVMNVDTTGNTGSQIVQPASGSYSLLSGSRSAGDIDAVVVYIFGGITSSGTGYFDNLCYSTSITGCGNQVSSGPSATPEPDSLLLLTFGLLAIVPLHGAKARLSSTRG
jgi:hypothetical protein